MTFLLDTNVCIEFLRGRNALDLQRVQARPPAEIRLCSIVVAELVYGCNCSAKPAKNRARLQVFSQPYVSLPFDDAAAEVHADIRAQLQATGMIIEPYDLQIAAIARVHNLTLVTHNTNHFNRIPGLALEDWQVP